MKYDYDHASTIMYDHWPWSHIPVQKLVIQITSVGHLLKDGTSDSIQFNILMEIAQYIGMIQLTLKDNDKIIK